MPQHDLESNTTSNPSTGYSAQAYLKAGLVFVTTTATFWLAKTTGFLPSWLSWSGNRNSNNAMHSNELALHDDAQIVLQNKSGLTIEVLDEPIADHLISPDERVEFHEMALSTPKITSSKPHFKTMGYVGGSEFQINTYTTSYQGDSSVAALSNGGFVVTWASYEQDGFYNVYGQHYDSTGAKVGSEFQVNTYTTYDQDSPSVAALSNGGFVVTWESDRQDGDSHGVYGQRYDSTGAKVGSEFQVNTYSTSEQWYPSVAALSNGGFVVTWASYGQDGYWMGVYGQCYGSTGTKVGSEFQINTYTTNSQDSPSVAALNNGGFVVTWTSDGQDGDSLGVYGQRYDSTAAKVGSEFQVNTYTTSYQISPSVAALSNGSFVVTWASDGQDGDWMGVYGQRYGSTGAKVGSEFQINAYTASYQEYPSVAALSNGAFVVTWHSDGQDGDSIGIYGQRYDSTGVKVGNEFQINTYTISLQSFPSVAALSNGAFVVTWTSDGQDGDDAGVYGCIFQNIQPILAIPLIDQTASVGNSFNYAFASNSFTYAGNTALTYMATQSNGLPLPSWLNFNTSSRAFSGVPSKTVVGITSVTVTANDGEGDTISDTFNIVISPSLLATNLNQTLEYIEDQPLDLGDITITDTASTQVSATLTLSNAAAGTLSAPTSGSVIATHDSQTGIWRASGLTANVVNVVNAVQFIPALNYNQNIFVNTRIADGINEDLTGNIIFHGIAVNDAPVVNHAIPNQSLQSGASFVYVVPSNTFADVDDSSLTYTASLSNGNALPAWLSFNPATRTFSGTPGIGGRQILSLRVTATDAGNLSTFDDFTLTLDNQAPILANAINAQTAAVGQLFSVSLPVNTFTDGDGDTLTYGATLSDGTVLPNWLSFDASTRTLSGTPSKESTGMLTVKIAVDDGNGGSSFTTFALTVNPSLTATNLNQNLLYTEDQVLNLNDVTITDTASNTVIATLTLVDPTAGQLNMPTYGSVTANYNAQTGIWTASGSPTEVTGVLQTVVFTPAANVNRATSIAVQISDGINNDLSGTVTLNGLAVNDAPIVANVITAQAAKVGEAFQWAIPANAFNDVDGETLTYSASLADGSSLPSWLSFAASTQTLSGTPAKEQVGDIIVKVVATDSAGSTASTTFSLTVAPSLTATPLNSQLSYTEDTEASLPAMQITTPANSVTVTLTLSNPALGQLTTPTSGSITSSYNAQTGIWTATGAPSEVVTILNQLQFKPTANANADVTISLRIADGLNDDLTGSIALHGIAVNDAPVVATTITVPNQSVEAGKLFSYSFDNALFTDPEGETLTYTAKLESGADLPVWLNFDAVNRRFYGTAGTADEGSVRIRITAADPEGATTNVVFAVNVLPAVQAAVQASDSLSTKIGGGIAGGLGSALVAFGLWKYQGKKEAEKKREKFPLANRLHHQLQLNINDFESDVGMSFVSIIKHLEEEFDQAGFTYNGHQLKRLTPSELNEVSVYISQAIKEHITLQESHCVTFFSRTLDDKNMSLLRDQASAIVVTTQKLVEQSGKNVQRKTSANEVELTSQHSAALRV